MKVAYHLRRVCETRPVLALLLPERDCARLLAVCVRLKLDPLPAIFAVHDGFLLRLRRPLREPAPGLIRLGELAANVLLPVDAELVPGLLADETAALGRDRGLVFLPEGGVLEFAPDQPLPLSQLLEVGARRERSWRPLAEPPALAQRLQEITLALEDPPADELLQAGGAGIGVDAPRPDSSSLPAKALGRASLGLGKALAWLGGLLHLKGMRRLGAKLIASAMKLAPRLSEKVLGAQEAALRALLNKFRAGKIDEALRRAMPIGDEPNRGAQLARDANLPVHRVTYSLDDLLGSSSGPGSVWMSHGEVMQELIREYRKEAEAATRRGDYRRAAFIYGKLLSDYRLAAAVLAQGSLHHDAALLYLHKLNDPMAAAREFEAAGDVDRALGIYRQRGAHIPAAELLRRIGEEAAAQAEYTVAAEVVVAQQGHYEAGLLLLTARLPELARRYFEAGWSGRKTGTAEACATSLCELYADERDDAALVQLVGEAEEHFAPRGRETQASHFFNGVARLASRPSLRDLEEELRDRALIGLAHKLRQAASEPGVTGQLVPAFFGAGTIWETPLVSDAQFAVSRPRPSAEVTATTTVIHAVIPIVRAVCHAAESGEVFVGFESGALASYDLSHGNVQYLEVQDGCVHSLAVSADGNTLVVVARNERSGEDYLACYLRHGDYRLVEKRSLGREGDFWLAARVSEWHKFTAALWDGSRGAFSILRGPRLLAVAEIRGPHPPRAALMPPFTSVGSTALLAFDGRDVTAFSWLLDADPSTDRMACPFPGASSPLGQPPISFQSAGPEKVQLVGIGEEGVLTWMELHYQGGRLIGAKNSSTHAAGPYAAATLAAPGLIAGVTRDAIVWLRATDSGIRELKRLPVSIAKAIACYAYPSRAELAVLDAGGAVTCVRQIAT